jgi:hypothetical protein
MHDNPLKGLIFECERLNDGGCSSGGRLALDFQGRSPEELERRAGERGWRIIGKACFCPAHASSSQG